MTLLLPLILWAALASAAESDIEAKVKAAYLFHLTKFVEWPALPPDALRICVIGSQAVGSILGELSNRQVQDRPLRVEVVETIGDLSRCQVLFIGRSNKSSGELLNKVRGAGVLTISDQEDFARAGGMVSFYFDGGKLKLEINQDAARSANLKISSKLLELSRKATP